MTKICQNVKIIFFGLINEFKFDLLAKTRGLYLVPKLRNLNLRKSSCSGVGEPWVGAEEVVVGVVQVVVGVQARGQVLHSHEVAGGGGLVLHLNS